MLLASFLLFAAISFVTLFRANGQTNLVFTCISSTSANLTQSYQIFINRRSQIVVNNCTALTVNHILFQLRHSKLGGQPIRVHLPFNDTFHKLDLHDVSELDLSNNKLGRVDLRTYSHLKILNVTSNKISELKMIELPSNRILEVVDASRNRILRIEGNSIPSTRRLTLRSNNIFDLDENFTLPSTLYELDLTRNEIENLTCVQFSSSTLQLLDLSINLISSISKSTFARLDSLKILKLECNKIFELPPGMFTHNRKLTELNLRDNNLLILTKLLFDDLINLQVLDVSKNHLASFAPGTMQNLNNLVQFSISENTKLCTKECKNELQFLLVLGGRLKILNMSRLGLKRFPVTLTTSIRFLDLSVNQLTFVQIGDLENFPFLQVLALNSNQIQTTDKDVFARLEYLEELYLEDNRLVQVPALLPTTIRILHLNKNRIALISRTDFLNLSNLKVLKLNANLIVSIESESFISLSTLRILDISDNPISMLNTDTLEGANKLEIFRASYLTRVNINSTDLRYFPVSELPNLRSMNLSHSPQLVRSFLKDFPLLTTVTQLENLDIDYANLTRFPPHLQHFFPRLKSISLMGNLIDCNSESQDWRQPLDLDCQPFTSNNSDLKVQIVRDPVDILPETRVSIKSTCLFNATYSNTSIFEFWEKFKLPNSIATQIPFIHYTSNPTSKKSGLQDGGTPEFKVITEQQQIEKSLTAALSKQDVRKDILENISSSTIPIIRTRILPFKAQKSVVDSKLPHQDTRVWERKEEEEKKFEALKNRSDERSSSFFDWFPPVNESSSDDSGTIAALNSNKFEYTHPGLILFLILSTFLLLVFLSLVAPTYIQNYRCKKNKYRNSEYENECQRSIEINSISAFVETELSAS